MGMNQAPGSFPAGIGKSSRAKLAYYLAREVGEARIFTMSAVREALPNVNQIDRRMRELREVGWEIRTYRDRTTLAPNEYLLETIGDRIWEPTYVPVRKAGISAVTRRKVFERDGNRCRECGIGAGEEYADRPGHRARMTIGHWVPKLRGGSDGLDNLRTECAMCNEPSKDLTETPVDSSLVKAQVKQLSRKERERLMKWVLADRRTFDNVEEVWANYRRLPTQTQDEIRVLLADLMA
jgi:hypothetical protein